MGRRESAPEVSLEEGRMERRAAGGRLTRRRVGSSREKIKRDGSTALQRNLILGAQKMEKEESADERGEREKRGRKRERSLT